MKTRSIQTLVAALIVVAGGRLCVQLMRSNVSMTGEATVVDNGLFSYPRYILSFPAIRGRATTFQQFRTGRMPTQIMTLELRVVPQEAARSLFDSEATVSVVVRSALDGVHYEADAPARQWKLAQSETTANLWHLNLRDMKLGAHDAYEISIAMRGVDASTFLSPLSQVSLVEVTNCLSKGPHSAVRSWRSSALAS